jgi:hypothetical protein
VSVVLASDLFLNQELEHIPKLLNKKTMHCKTLQVLKVESLEVMTH